MTVTAKSPISAAEIEGWFKSSRTLAPSSAQCEDLAQALSGWRWPSVPPKPSQCREMIPHEVEEMEAEWWNVKGAIAAAKELGAAIPNMLKHSEGLGRWSETRGGYEAIEKLREALVTAKPYIEFPLGPYEPAKGQKSPKPWHLAAVLVAGLLVSTMDEFTSRSLAKNSVIVRVVRQALNRMGYPQQEAGTVSQYLSRWRERWGGLPNFNDHKASGRAL